MRYFWMLLILGAGLSACEQTHPPQSGVDLNQIGNEWMYDVYVDSTSNPGQAKITVVSDTVLDNGKPARKWRIELPDQALFRYVEINPDTFKQYDSPAHPEPRHLIPMNQLAVGHQWEGLFCFDTATVVQQASFSVAGTTYEESWQLDRKAGFCVNWYMEQTLWWRNDLGFVRLETTEYRFGLPRLEVYELVDANLGN